jgi:diguanylate cyclase
MNTPRRGMSLPRRFYGPRCLGLALGFLTVYASLATPAGQLTALITLLLYCFAWPHLAYQLAARSAHPARCERRSMLFDAMAAGYFAGAMGFNPLPSVVIVTMVVMNNMACGGVSFLLRGALATALGAGVAWLSLSATLVHLPSAGQVNACLPLLVLYPLSLGYVCYLTATQLARHKDELRVLGNTDHLTGLTNRKALNDLLERFDEGHPSDVGNVVALIDVDHFKQINDRHGHLFGDRVLEHIAQVMRACVREQDTVGRYGGDEFCVILRDVSRSQAQAILERMRRLAERPDSASALPLASTLSIGAALYVFEARNSSSWLHEADVALYQAKRDGRNRVAFSG